MRTPSNALGTRPPAHDNISGAKIQKPPPSGRPSSLRMVTGFSRFLLAGGVMLLLVPGSGQIPVNSVPYTIHKPGNYFLHKDLTYGIAAGTAIVINSSNVTLDFNGHELICTVTPPTNPGSGVAVGTDQKPIENVTIKNGTVSRFLVGIDLGGGFASSKGHVVQGMRLTNHFSSGITSADLVSGCLIKNNYVSGCDKGIQDTGKYNQFLRNRTLDCPTAGITCSSFGYLENNFVSNSTNGFNCSELAKLRFNTTLNCATPFVGGTQIADDNN